MESATTEILSPNPNENPNRTLNDLPTEILIHILSLIPTVDAIHTSLVSRHWRSLWSRLPVLDFPYDDLFSVNNDFGPLPVTSHRFAELIDRALILCPNSPIQSFNLSFIFYHYYTSHLDSWIRCALSRFQERELHLDFYIHRLYHVGSEDAAAAPPSPDRYEFRFSVLRESNVESLSLTRVDLVLPASMANSGFGLIWSMYLDDVELADEMWELLIKGCPNLQDLELRNGLMEQTMGIWSRRRKKGDGGIIVTSMSDVSHVR